VATGEHIYMLHVAWLQSYYMCFEFPCELFSLIYQLEEKNKFNRRKKKIERINGCMYEIRGGDTPPWLTISCFFFHLSISFSNKPLLSSFMSLLILPTKKYTYEWILTAHVRYLRLSTHAYANAISKKLRECNLQIITARMRMVKNKMNANANI